MPLALTFRRVDVKKVQGRPFAAYLQKAAGVITMPGKRSGELSPALQVTFKVRHGAKVHSDAATPVNINDSADMTPKISRNQSAGKKVERLLFVPRQRVISALVAFVTPEPAKFLPVALALLFRNFGPDERLFIDSDRHVYAGRKPRSNARRVSSANS